MQSRFPHNKMPPGIYIHKPLSEDHKRNISAALKGREFSYLHRKRIGAALMGQVFSESRRKAISERQKGRRSPMKGRKFSPEQVEKSRRAHIGFRHSDESKEKIKQANVRTQAYRRLLGHTWNKGKKGLYCPSTETRLKISRALKLRGWIPNRPCGDKHYHWKGGITKKNLAIRASFEMRQWRRAVFERDDFTYVMCGKRGVTIHADHIKPFAFFPDLRFDITNGRTLCVPCHRATDTYAGRGPRLNKIVTNQPNLPPNAIPLPPTQ